MTTRSEAIETAAKAFIHYVHDDTDVRGLREASKDLEAALSMKADESPNSGLSEPRSPSPPAPGVERVELFHVHNLEMSFKDECDSRFAGWKYWKERPIPEPPKKSKAEELEGRIEAQAMAWEDDDHDSHRTGIGQLLREAARLLREKK